MNTIEKIEITIGSDGSTIGDWCGHEAEADEAMQEYQKKQIHEYLKSEYPGVDIRIDIEYSINNRIHVGVDADFETSASVSQEIEDWLGDNQNLWFEDFCCSTEADKILEPV